MFDRENTLLIQSEPPGINYFITLMKATLYFLLALLIKRQSCRYIETNQLICFANQLTGFYMMATLAFNELSELTQVVNFK